MKSPATRNHGFTLVELLVSVSVIAVLLSILIPTINAGRRSARVVACQANLRTIGQLVQVYAQQNDGRIPRGPSYELPAAADKSISASLATTVAWLGNPSTIDGVEHPPQYIGVGLLLKQPGKTGNEFMFCPGDGNPNRVNEQAGKIGQEDNSVDAGQGDFQLLAETSYYYRQMDLMSPEVERDGLLDDLRSNYGTSVQTGHPESGGPFKVEVAALALDAHVLARGPNRRSNHQGRKVNVVYLDTSVQSLDNEPRFIDATEQEPWGAVSASAFDNGGVPIFDELSCSLDRVFLAADYSFRADPTRAPVPPCPLYP